MTSTGTGSSPALSPEQELALAEAQIGRKARGESAVASRCHLSLPVVLQVPPNLETGEPFPTRYWLSCPLAVLRISRRESTGAIADLEARRREDPAFAEAVRVAHVRYAEERDAAVEGEPRHRPRGGVAGAREGVKCLHAHYADHRAGNDNPIGAITASHIEPLNCPSPCVRFVDGAAERDPGWRAPDEAETSVS